MEVKKKTPDDYTLGIFSTVFLTAQYTVPTQTAVKDYVFFFKQKTAYEISSRDLSSDVCSSDLKQKTAYEISSRLNSSHVSLSRMPSSACVDRSEEHTSELQSRELISYAVFC